MPNGWCAHKGVWHACSWEKYVIVGKGYAKTDTEVSMKMRGELFEVTPPILPVPILDLPCSSRLSALVFTLTLQWQASISRH